ncbi:MAG: hypothetical protein JSS86_19455 [Cyanobacteria bacterium SZAS LIN-2]|nr:hypothetical protein [Cyanobacteria bacterium SZAS LIN-3]MBS1998515.1 hypothetical protein [Cyanobacteria bacterium SZAS LIN-2]MBS2010711.1 hypothetical protein [Cyanobacteria bacterium SZAS TMP-1]
MDPQLRQEAQYVACLIDNGQVERAAAVLREDLCQLDGYSGRQLLAATRAYERPGGAELIVHHGRDRYGCPTDQLVAGIAVPCRDEYGSSSWDVIDIATVSSRSRQTYQPDYSYSDYGDYRGYRDYRDYTYYDRGPTGDYLPGNASGSFFRPRQRIWSDETGYWTPGGVPYNNQQTFNMPGSRYAYPITSSPWNYSTVGDPRMPWGNRWGRPTYGGSYRGYDGYADYGGGGVDSRYLTTYLALNALGALSLSLRRSY